MTHWSVWSSLATCASVAWLRQRQKQSAHKKGIGNWSRMSSPTAHEAVVFFLTVPLSWQQWSQLLWPASWAIRIRLSYSRIPSFSALMTIVKPDIWTVDGTAWHAWRIQCCDSDAHTSAVRDHGKFWLSASNGVSMASRSSSGLADDPVFSAIALIKLISNIWATNQATWWYLIFFFFIIRKIFDDGIEHIPSSDPGQIGRFTQPKA